MSKPIGRYTYHYLNPEKLWGVFDRQTGALVALFDTSSEAQDYCTRHNDKTQ